MSEHIIEVEYDTFNGTFTQKRREEIVRCRDCYYCTDSPAWPGANECEFINRGVEPDGFCAWGERRADHD